MKQRIDGLDKVTGAKVYGRDFRPPDLGWPTPYLHALIVRAPTAGVLWEGLAPFPEDARPVALVRAVELTRAGIKPNGTFADEWLLPLGQVVPYVGQPLAIAYFDTPRAYRAAVAFLKRPATVFTGGPRVLPSRTWQDVYLLRCEDPDNKYELPDRLDLGKPGEEASRAIAAREKMFATLAKKPSIRRTFESPTHDPMFMEPESGNAWWDPQKKELHVDVGTQSPWKDRQNIERLFPADALETLLFTARPPGGGFGGRDLSSFPCYLALAAWFAPGAPVRMAFTREEQFAAGIKRHAGRMDFRLAIEGTEAKPVLAGLVASIELDGGGEKNLTGAVAQLAALHAGGPYRFPRFYVHARGLATKGAPSGSMRGFGIPQSTLAIECLMDEAAARFGQDSIAFRHAHLLRTGERDATGRVLEHDLANVRLCEQALAHPAWKEREAVRARSGGDLAYGVGFAMCMEAFGTTSDAAQAAVLFGDDGSVRVHSTAVDMGQGSQTALAVATREWLGVAASQVTMGETLLFQSEAFDKFEYDLTNQDAPEHRRLPRAPNAMSASMTAFHKVHAVEQACAVLWDHALRPVVREITLEDVARPRWHEGELRIGDHRLTLGRLIGLARERGRPTGAAVHTHFQNRFAMGTWKVGGLAVRRPVAALSLRFAGQEGWEIQEATELTFPNATDRGTTRTLYASAAHLLGIEVHRRSGVVRVTRAVTFLDAGHVLHEDLLRGQVEGGLAMGIGMALTEEMPAAPEGVWNLHRYQVPRIRNVPVGAMELELVPLPGDNVLGLPEQVVARKGIAEATMTTVAPALLNAFAHATGVRVSQVPLTPARVRAALGLVRP